MAQKLLSVIVPVYKVEKFLDRCIQSLLKQTYRNLQIILVDDGSPDNSGIICDYYAKKDFRIEVIHQSNKGLSGARNRGLIEARGEYIAFLDSDDWIEPDMYETLIGLMEKNNLDMARCSIDETDGSFHRLKTPSKQYANRVYENNTCLDLYFHEFLCKVVWNAVYKRDIVDGILSPEGHQSEDNYVSGRYLFRCKRIWITSKVLHHYWMNPDGITRAHKIKPWDICICTSLLIKDLPKDGIVTEKYKVQLKRKLARELFHYIRSNDLRCQVIAIKKKQKYDILKWLDFSRKIRFLVLLCKKNIKIYKGEN